MAEHEHLFRKILVATDFSDGAAAALSHAVWLAERMGAEVTLAHVIPVTKETMATFSTNPWYVAANGDEIEDRLRRETEKRLRGAIAPYRSRGVTLNYQTLWGIPIVEIIHTVQDDDFDLVVVGTRGASAVSRFLIGSTASKLARKCPCPVWTVRLQPDEKIATILAPVDFSEVSRKSLRLAAHIAARTACSLHVLHVYASEPVYPLDLLAEADEMEISQRRRVERRLAIERLRGLVADLDLPIEPVLHVERGDAWRRILSTAKRIGANLTVMGTVGRGGVEGMLIGNTAEKVLHSGERSLLAVKPDGFVSPIRVRAATVHA